jgi:hypothetical protein
MNMLYIGAQIAYGDIGRFAVITEGVMHIPQRSEFILREGIQKSTEPSGVRIDPGRFDKKTLIRVLNLRKDDFEVLTNLILAVLLRAYGNITRLEDPGSIEQPPELVRTDLLRTQVNRSIQAGNGKMLFLQVPERLIEMILVKGTASLSPLGSPGQIIDFNSLKMILFRISDLVLPGKMIPSPGRKREIHSASSS